MCLRKLLLISYLEHETNVWVRSKINFLVGPQEPLLETLETETCMVRTYHTPRQPLKTLLQGTLEVGDATVGRGNAGWTTSKSGHPCPF